VSRFVRAILLAAAGIPVAWATAGTTPAPAAAASMAPSAAQSKPAHEWCIAGVCLGHPEQDLVGRYGAGRLFPAETPWEHCYQARGKSIYLTAMIDEEDPGRRIMVVLLSGETNCPDAATARVGPDRAGCRGIRLFDPVEKLETVDATKRSPEDKNYPWHDSPSEVNEYDYRCEPEKSCSVMATAYVRGSTIIAISIWEPDC
jgi:hypothetical protein